MPEIQLKKRQASEIPKPPGLRYWSLFRIVHLNSLRSHTLHVNLHDKSLSTHPQRSTERQWWGGSPNNPLLWLRLLASPSQEQPAHHRPSLQDQRNPGAQRQVGIQTEVWGRDTLSGSLPGLSQETLIPSVQVWYPIAWVNVGAPLGMRGGFTLGVQDMLRDMFQDCFGLMMRCLGREREGFRWSGEEQAWANGGISH